METSNLRKKKHNPPYSLWSHLIKFISFSNQSDCVKCFMEKGLLNKLILNIQLMWPMSCWRCSCQLASSWLPMLADQKEEVQLAQLLTVVGEFTKSDLPSDPVESVGNKDLKIPFNWWDINTNLNTKPKYLGFGWIRSFQQTLCMLQWPLKKTHCPLCVNLLEEAKYNNDYLKVMIHNNKQSAYAFLFYFSPFISTNLPLKMQSVCFWFTICWFYYHKT